MYQLRRLARKYREAGMGGLLRRAVQLLAQNLFQSRIIVYCLDLQSLNEQELEVAPELTVLRLRDREVLSPEILQALAGYRDRQLLERQLCRRFGQGAELWVGKKGPELFGFEWVIRRPPLREFYFPLTEDDVYSFDGAVFPQYRGGGLYLALHRMMMRELRSSGVRRWIFAVNEWNQPMIRAVTKSRFRALGLARRARLFGRNLVIWCPGKKLDQLFEAALRAGLRAK